MSDGHTPSGSADTSLADRMRSVMTEATRPINEAATAAAQAGPESELFSLVQEQPFKLAQVEDPVGGGTVPVLYPAPMPRPPNTVETEFVGPAEAMEVIATTPLEIVEFDSSSFPDFAAVPSSVGDEITPD